jgi:hypothetical protein
VRRSLQVLSVGLVVGLVLSAGYIAKRQTTGPSMVVGEASQWLPAESPEDWVSYADHVFVGTVESERRMDVPEESARRGEGLVGRTISVSVTAKVWSRGSAATLPPTVDLLVWGWVLEGGKEIPFTSDGAPRPAVGQTYVFPVAQEKSGAWAVLAHGAVLPLQSGKFRLPTDVESSSSSPLARRFQGQTVDDLARNLRSAVPDPVAARFADRDADSRWAEVVKSRNPAAQSS